MLRISIDESEGNVVTLRLEGQIIGAWISELSIACERMLTPGRTVTLDLGDVSLIDRPGLTLLASLFAARGSPSALFALSRGATSIGIIATTSPQRTNSPMNRLQTLPAAPSEFALRVDPDRWVDDHGETVCIATR